MHESPDSGEWLAHAHQDLDNGYQALFFVPANFNIKIGPGDEATLNTDVRGMGGGGGGVQVTVGQMLYLQEIHTARDHPITVHHHTTD